MRCKNCGRENLNDSKFCSQCGKPLRAGADPRKMQYNAGNAGMSGQFANTRASDIDDQYFKTIAADTDDQYFKTIASDIDDQYANTVSVDMNSQYANTAAVDMDGRYANTAAVDMDGQYTNTAAEDMSSPYADTGMEGMGGQYTDSGEMNILNQDKQSRKGWKATIIIELAVIFVLAFILLAAVIAALIWAFLHFKGFGLLGEKSEDGKGKNDTSVSEVVEKTEPVTTEKATEENKDEKLAISIIIAVFDPN